jgi:hypothetical protein
MLKKVIFCHKKTKKVDKNGFMLIKNADTIYITVRNKLTQYHTGK